MIKFLPRQWRITLLVVIVFSVRWGIGPQEKNCETWPDRPLGILMPDLLTLYLICILDITSRVVVVLSILVMLLVWKALA